NKAGYYDILIQTTSIGMKPKINEMIMSLDNVKEGSVVSDIIYQPIHTTFLEHAKRNNALILPGHVMLLYQAKEAFEIWQKQKRFLRSKATQLKAIFQVGKTSVNENMLKQVNEALEKRELIKIAVLNNCLDDKDNVAEQLVQGTNATLVQIIGHNIILYKESE